MTTYQTPNLTGGMDDVIVDIVGTVDLFIPMLLLFSWGLIFFGGMASQRKRIQVIFYCWKQTAKKRMQTTKKPGKSMMLTAPNLKKRLIPFFQ